MNIKVSKFLESPWLLRLIAVLYLISQITIGIILHPLGIKAVLRMQTTTSARIMAEILDRWSADGQLVRFITHFYPDFLHPVWYGLLLVFLMFRILGNASVSRRWNYALFLPLIAAAMDYLENFLHLSFVFRRECLTDITAAIAGVASMLKWVMAGLSVMVIAGFYICQRFRLVHHKKQ